MIAPQIDTRGLPPGHASRATVFAGRLRHARAGLANARPGDRRTLDWATPSRTPNPP